MPDYTVSPVVSTQAKAFGTHVATTDATVTSVATVPTQSNQIYMVKAKVVGQTSNYSSGQAGYERVGLFKNVGGTLALVGSVAAPVTIETDAAWDCTLDASGTDIRVRVTGAAATNISWHAQVEVVNGKNYAAAFGTY